MQVLCAHTAPKALGSDVLHDEGPVLFALGRVCPVRHQAPFLFPAGGLRVPLGCFLGVLGAGSAADTFSCHVVDVRSVTSGPWGALLFLFVRRCPLFSNVTVTVYPPSVGGLLLKPLGHTL